MIRPVHNLYNGASQGRFKKGSGGSRAPAPVSFVRVKKLDAIKCIRKTWGGDLAYMDFWGIKGAHFQKLWKFDSPSPLSRERTDGYKKKHLL